jgi:hypothetical protein
MNCDILVSSVCFHTWVKFASLRRGARHPDMKKHVDDAFILTCNISMEYEKSEVGKCV